MVNSNLPDEAENSEIYIHLGRTRYNTTTYQPCIKYTSIRGPRRVLHTRLSIFFHFKAKYGVYRVTTYKSTSENGWSSWIFKFTLKLRWDTWEIANLWVSFFVNIPYGTTSHVIFNSFFTQFIEVWYTL